MDKTITNAYGWAFGLAVFTIAYNITEGLAASFFGYEDESLSLFGFGIDSFIEVVSGFGILQMILRIRKNPNSSRSLFEKRALGITGVSFYVLTVMLSITAIHNIVYQQEPETTFWGVVISLFSICIMWMLIRKKLEIGKILNSSAILADAECTRVCMYMSLILLSGSLVYELMRIPYVDALGSLGIAYLAFKEGKECFDKIKNNTDCCSCH